LTKYDSYILIHKGFRFKEMLKEEDRGEIERSLRRELPTLAAHSPGFRRQIICMVSKVFVRTEKLNQVLNEIRDLREDFNICFEEYSKRLEELSKRQEEHSRTLEELSKRFEEHSKRLEGHSKTIKEPVKR